MSDFDTTATNATSGGGLGAIKNEVANNLSWPSLVFYYCLGPMLANFLRP